MRYKFLIYISYSYAIPIGKPLEKEILSRGHEVVWFSDLEDGKQALENSPRKLDAIKEVIWYEPHIVLTITNTVPDFIKGLKVQVFHGFLAKKRPSKKHLFSEFKMRGFFDLYCTQGPSTTSVFKQLEEKHKYFGVIETGWSKVDPLFPVEQHDPAKTPDIMIASTFTERLSLAFSDAVFQEIKRLSSTGKYNFHMVLHPKIPQEIIDKWKALEGPYFSYYDTTEFIPLLKKTAVLFADTTSVVQEYSLQQKPIVSYNHTIEHDYLIHVHKPDMIEEKLDYALTYPEKILKNLATFTQNLHPYTDGKSSRRVVDTTINFLHKDKSHLRRKPLNLIRKFKIRNRLNHYSFRSYNQPYTLSTAKISTTREPVTVIIPVGNEIHNIEEVIASVDFADEILVVDSYSTDGTYEMACQKADRVIRREYQYSASQKNWAIPQAKYEWIILIDADERVTTPLELEIKDILNHNPSEKEEVGYWIGRKNHFMDEHVKHSGWRNDKVIRLFRKSKCRYEDKRVHEEIIADGKVGMLNNKFYHNTYISLDKHIEKINRYAWWQAKDYDSKIHKLTGYHFVVKPAWSFFKHYIIQGGFRDGVVGITVSYMQSYAVFMRYAKVWLLRRNRK